MKKIYTLSLLLALGISTNAQVVISQVYGGGGNTGATYTHDFIELFNRGSVAQSLNGWSVQYGSATGTTWAVTLLPNVMILPGQYFLIQEAVGGTPPAAPAGIALPTPDFSGISATQVPPTGLAMSGSNGKVILVNDVVAQSGTNPTGVQIIDKVGYGATPSGFEGTGPTGIVLTSTTSVSRNSGGCTDANSNATDFTNGNVLPRNTASPLNICPALSIQQSTISGLKVYPNPAKTSLNVTSDNNEVKEVVIYNVLGKVVVNAKITSSPINVSNLAKGVYVIKITEQEKTATRKLVIE
jgi:hypothetical protein